MYVAYTEVEVEELKDKHGPVLILPVKLRLTNSDQPQDHPLD